MALLDINSLPLNLSVELSDIFDVYTLSGEYIVPQTITYADLSGYFFSRESFLELSAKYDELLELMDSFVNFINKSYPKRADLPNLLTTRLYLSSVIEQLQTVQKTKEEILNDYASIHYSELMKARAYKNHEALASGFGGLRSGILGTVDTDVEME